MYKDPETSKDPNKHLMMIPTVLPTLKKLKKLGMILVILSANPQPPKEASSIMDKRVKHFQIGDLFDEVHATRDYRESKGEFITEILKRRGIPKSQALMVGDSYDWDIDPAKKTGVDAVLIKSEYIMKHPLGKRMKQTIEKMSDLILHI